ncbi:MAG: THxN family PEP-CTERM protein, partial [Cyanobacteriota bacterium]|nr:THxN family PEP-CTERM protein [Cyanobacteriota bacterium]
AELNVLVGSENQVRWGGTTDDKSGLGFAGAEMAEFDIGEIFKIGTLRHFNNSIPTGTEATAVDLGITLDFGTPSFSKVFNFTFDINETPNEDPCPVGNPPCADIISFPGPLPSEMFEFMGMNFTLELVKFASAVNEPGTNHFISPEGGTNSTMLFGKISKVNVPEPGILGALGLFSFYFVARRRQRNQG